jgi:hypothetical protein
MLQGALLQAGYPTGGGSIEPLLIEWRERDGVEWGLVWVGELCVKVGIGEWRGGFELALDKVGDWEVGSRGQLGGRRPGDK